MDHNSVTYNSGNSHRIGILIIKQAVHPKSNSKAENAVKTVKQLMRKSLTSMTDPYVALLDYRNTPTEGMTSSSVQRIMNRRTKTLLPTAKPLLHPKLIDDSSKLAATSQDRVCITTEQSKTNHMQLQAEQHVRIQPFNNTREWRQGTMKRQLSPRLNAVETTDRQTYRRNRIHLRPTKEILPMPHTTHKTIS